MSPHINRSKLERLTKRFGELDPDALAQLAGSMVYAHIPDIDNVARPLCQEVARLLDEAAWDDEVTSKAVAYLPRLLVARAAIVRNRSQLAAADGWGAMRKAVREAIGAPLASVFEHDCRIRVWAMDAAKSCYVGLLTLGMGPVFRAWFESEDLVLAREDAPYTNLPNSDCLVLSKEMIDKFLRIKGDNARAKELARLYTHREMLGIGPVVEETYTFEFQDGEDDMPWALSFDLGGGSGDPASTRCDRLVLRTVELLLTPLLKDVSFGLKAINSKSPSASGINPMVKADESILLDRIGLSAAEGDEDPVNESSECVERDIATPLHSPASSAPPDRAVQDVFDAKFDCIPCTYADGVEGNPPLPWVFSLGDEGVRHVLRWWIETRKHSEAGASLLYGPSGCGKTVLAATLAGPGGRQGPVVISNWPRGALGALQKVKGGITATDMPYAPSDVERAGRGVVVIDEALTAILSDSTGLGTLRGPVEDIINGRLIAEEYADDRGVRRQWRAQAYVVFTGSESEYRAIIGQKQTSHWSRRFGEPINVPGWSGLTPASRAVVLRWYVLSVLSEKALVAAELDAVVLGAVIYGLHPRVFFDRENMSGLRALAKYAGKYGRCNSGVLAIDAELFTTFLRDRVGLGPHGQVRELARQLSQGPLPFIRLGVGSPFEARLSPLEKIIVRMAACGGREQSGHCVDEAELTEALTDVSSQDDVYRTAYLFSAAVRRSRDSAGNDPQRTGCMRYQQHFENKKPWERLVNEYLPRPVGKGRQATPADLKTAGPSKGALGDNFAEFVLNNARTIQQSVERLACAYPPLLHVPPYWHWPEILSDSTYGEDDTYVSESQ